MSVQLTAFIGREEEMAQARRLAGRSRLLTLTGPGGCGKTRLATELAAQLEREHGEVRFCDLTSATEPSMVEATVAAALGADSVLDATPGRLAGRLRSHRALLLLDNCEHVLEAAAALAEQLLLDCADLQIIATSREPLAVPGELTMRVPALPLPSAEDEGDPRRLLDSAAVRLFVDRAQLADADFQLVAADGPALAQVCRRLDGIPLALELAAAQMRTMTVQTLLEGLNDRFRLLVSGRGRPRRQQTLEATVEWSFARLRPDEQSVFARLSVLGGGFTVETARRVAAGGAIRSQDVLPLTARLVEQSLLDLEARGGRYRMPETIREYGRLVLRTSGETVRVLRAAAAEADSRQAHWSALSLLQAALDELPPDDQQRRDLLDQLAWQAECAGSYSVGAEALQALDKLLTGESDLAARATVQLRLSSFLPMAGGDLEAAEEALNRALELYKAAGETGRVRAVANQLAWARGYRADIAGMADAARQVASDARAAGDRTVLRNAMGALGAASVPLGDLEEARRALQGGLAIATSDDDATQAGWFSSLLGLADGLGGQLAVGRTRVDRVLNTADQPASVTLEVSAFLHQLGGNYRGALKEVKDGEALLSAFHVRAIWTLGIGAAAAAELGEAAAARSYAERAQELGRGRDFFYQSRATRWMLGLAAWCSGDRDEGRRLIRDAATELGKIGARPLAALALRDLADLCREKADTEEASSAEAELARMATQLDLPLLRALAIQDPEEGAAELGRLGYHGLRARRLEHAGRFEEAASLHQRLGSQWRAERALAELARSGGHAMSPGARTLSGLVLTEAANAPELEELAAGLGSARYRAGELVHRRGDEARTVEIVESGRIRLGITTAAGERALGEVGPGELFGERALLAGELRATDALAVEDSRLLSLDARALIRFIEPRPAIAERAVALLRLRLRQEAALTGEPEPSDAAGRLLGAVQRLSLDEGRSLPAYEILPVYLGEDEAWLLRPRRSGSFQVDAGAGVPAEVVGSALEGAGLRAEIVHSTSWRYQQGRLVLTYLAVLPSKPGRDLESTGFEAVAVVRTELARGTARAAPAEIGVAQVVEHGLRHLSWLSRDDPAIRRELSAGWLELVDRYQPEPFRAL
ncbi:MAG TPA: cyclic nucleotide-binding domain-containing protein [Candidatus Dormibacteraeota bacterium]